MTNFQRWMIAFTVTLLAVTEVLDITIVSVALQNMQGALSANSTEITWTITVYIIASAIFMPLTGYLTDRFGRRNLLFISALLFGAASFMCGLSQNLMQMVIFRGLQGIGGAILPSLAQSTLMDTFSGKEANKAMALFGVGVMLGPVIGPVLGGYITDNLSWQWIFFINVPICIVAAMLTLAFIPKQGVKKEVKNDWMGLVLLAVSIGAMQYVLDKGNEVGWFSDQIIELVAVISVFTFAVFVIRGINKPHHVVDFSVFKDKNYAMACFIMLVYCTVIMGTFSWLPLWMEVFMNYPASTAGALLIPRGIMLLICIGISPLLLKFIDGRWLVVIACIFYGIGSFYIAGFNLEQGPEHLFWSNILQGIGGGLFFVPLSSLAYQTLPKVYLDTASGLFNFFRNFGSSIGVAIFSAIMSFQAQQAWQTMGAHISNTNPNFALWLQSSHMSAQNPTVYPQLAGMLIQQGNMIAFDDANAFFGLLCFLIIPLVFLVHPKKGMPNIAIH